MRTLDDLWVKFIKKNTAHCHLLLPSLYFALPVCFSHRVQALVATLCILSITSHTGQIAQEWWDKGEGWQRGRPLAIVPSKMKVLSDDLPSSLKLDDNNSKVFFPRIAPIVPESWTCTRFASWVRPYTSAFVLFIKTSLRLSWLWKAFQIAWNKWVSRAARSH